MKSITTIVSLLLMGVMVLLATVLQAQAPEKMSYQAVIRDGFNMLVINETVGIQISILQGSVGGSAVFVETHMAMTNDNGLVSLEIGAGNFVLGEFGTIEWGEGPCFIKTETDPTGGTNYTITGTSQLLSVPYALHANSVKVKVSNTGDTLTIGSQHVIVPGISGANYKVKVDCDPDNPTAVVDVLNPATGKTWMDRNLGASQVAQAFDDPLSYGDLYQWGRLADGHQCRNSGTTTTLSSSDVPGHGDFILAPNIPYDWRSPKNDNLWRGVNGVNNPCPSGYRVPTESELNAERLSWSSNDRAGAFASPLKLPSAGLRNLIDGSIITVGAHGNYSSSTIIGMRERSSYFDSNSAFIVSGNRAHGSSVRCIKD